MSRWHLIELAHFHLELTWTLLLEQEMLVWELSLALDYLDPRYHLLTLQMNKETD